MYVVGFICKKDIIAQDNSLFQLKYFDIFLIYPKKKQKNILWVLFRSNTMECF